MTTGSDGSFRSVALPIRLRDGAQNTTGTFGRRRAPRIIRVLIRHRLCLERLPVGVRHQSRPETGLCSRRLPGARIGDRCRNDGRSGSGQKAPAIHGQPSRLSDPIPVGESIHVLQRAGSGEHDVDSGRSIRNRQLSAVEDHVVHLPECVWGSCIEDQER